MRILNNFNTKLDEQKIKDAVSIFGKYKVVLFKRHQIYLSSLIFYFLILGVLFGLTFTSIYLQLENNKDFKILTLTLFSGIFIIWFLTTIFKIKSFLIGYNPIILDVSEKDFQDGKFERFIKFSFLFYIFQVLLSILLVTWEYVYVGENTIMGIFSLKAQLVLQILMFFLMYKILMRIIKFEMDYYIITPNYIDINVQHSLFSKENILIENSKITSIRFYNAGVINSYFNYGNIIIFTEGNSEASSEYKIEYAPKVDTLNRIIADISGIKS